MAPTVLQLAPDPQEPGEIIANVVPLQITVRPRVLSGADYNAISTLFTVAADTRRRQPGRPGVRHVCRAAVDTATGC